jgi:cell division protease FtsH
MVAQWGFSKNKLGATSWESPDGNGGFGPKGASAATEKAIDDEVKELVDDAYAHCKKTLLENRKLLDEVTDALLEKETIDFRELYTLVGKYDPALEAAQKANFPPEMGGPGGDMPKVEEAVA